MLEMLTTKSQHLSDLKRRQNVTFVFSVKNIDLIKIMSY